MTSSTVERLVADYLARLRKASATLPPERRNELLEEIGNHIATAQATGTATDEAAVRTLLDRLGHPNVIVAAALDDAPSTAARPHEMTARSASTRLELAAVLMLTVGSFVPVLGWLVGVMLLWVSSLWTKAEKLVATLVVPLGPGGVFVLGTLLPGQTCYSSSVEQVNGGGTNTAATREVCTGFAFPLWLGMPLLIAALVAPFVVGVVLYRRACARSGPAVE